MVYLGMRSQGLEGQVSQISARSLNADAQPGGAACFWNRYAPVIISPVRRAMTCVQLGTLQRRHPSWRELNCGCKKENKAAVLPLMQTSGICQRVAAVHVTALWVRRCRCTCSHGSSLSECPSAARAAPALLCCPKRMGFVSGL